nr:PREDICTED: LOW QUALITY PROTEIN: uncharacterized protein LOC109034857 [Bemisia tabaci]
MDFQGKVVLVTGASGGIGTGIAKLFATRGATLALTGRDLTNLEKVAAECKRLSGRAPFVFKADLTKDSECKNLIESVLAQFKRLDVLVNNAGIAVMGSMESTSMEQYDEVFIMNVRSVFLLTKLATPNLLATKGSIVNVSSQSGLRSYPGIIAYCMSKSAIDQFTRCLALELASRGVRVNSVNPGNVMTQLLKRAGLVDTKQFFEGSKKTHPLGRPGTAEEIARAVAFLASEEASFTTGATFPVDGGRSVFGISNARKLA